MSIVWFYRFVVDRIVASAYADMLNHVLPVSKSSNRIKVNWRKLLYILKIKIQSCTLCFRRWQLESIIIVNQWSFNQDHLSHWLDILMQEGTTCTSTSWTICTCSYYQYRTLIQRSYELLIRCLYIWNPTLASISQSNAAISSTMLWGCDIVLFLTNVVSEMD